MSAGRTGVQYFAGTGDSISVIEEAKPAVGYVCLAGFLETYPGNGGQQTAYAHLA
jgi:hypothetical protein